MTTTTQQATSPIEITNLRPTTNGGNFKATFSILIHGKTGAIALHECRLIQQPGKAWFWCGAQRQYTDKAGAKKYVSLFSVPKPLEEKIKLVLEPQVRHLLEPPPQAQSNGADYDDIPY